MHAPHNKSNSVTNSALCAFSMFILLFGAASSEDLLFCLGIIDVYVEKNLNNKNEKPKRFKIITEG